MQREEHGFPIRGVNGLFNTADLTAKLSGVSLASVVRVIAALDVISQTHNVAPSLLIEHFRTPTALPDADRSAQTQAAFNHVMGEREHIDTLVWDSLKTPDKVA